jgi:hypothetical protein
LLRQSLLLQKDALGPLDRSGRAALPKQTADNADRNDVENRADHHAAQSAEQYEDVGLTRREGALHRGVVPTLPDRLIEQMTPLSAISRWNCSLVYWLPRSE